MTLFLVRPKRTIEMSDAYLMGLVFIVSFILVTVLKKATKRLIVAKNDPKNKHLKKAIETKGGASWEDIVNYGLEEIILGCVDEETTYLVKDRLLARIISTLVKVKLRNNTIVISQNLVRVIASFGRYSNTNKFIEVSQNFILFVEHTERLKIRMQISAAIGVFSALVTGVLVSGATAFAYGLLMLVTAFDVTGTCMTPCEQYLEKITDEQAIIITESGEEGQVVITSPQNVGKISVYAEEKQKIYKEYPESSNEELSSLAEELVIQKNYRKKRRKVKEVKYSDFVKTIREEIAGYLDLPEEEPIVDQRPCPIPIDIEDFRID